VQGLGSQQLGHWKGAESGRGRVRDQGEALCFVAESLHMLRRPLEAKAHYDKARLLGEQHGFLSVEGARDRS